jgi:hypothetical protein
MTIELYQIGISTKGDDQRAIIGLVLQRNKKFVHNIKDQTIEIYDNYDCKYTPA